MLLTKPWKSLRWRLVSDPAESHRKYEPTRDEVYQYWEEEHELYTGSPLYGHMELHFCYNYSWGYCIADGCDCYYKRLKGPNPVVSV